MTAIKHDFSGPPETAYLLKLMHQKQKVKTSNSNIIIAVISRHIHAK